MASKMYDKLKGFGKSKSFYDGVKVKVENGIEQAFMDFGAELVNDVVAELISQQIDNTGALKDSINFVEITDSSNNKTYELRMLDYYKYIESGRAKGSLPPLAPILSWVQTKKNRALFTKSFPKYDTMTLTEMAENKRWSIFHYGIKAKPFLTKVSNDGRLNELTKKVSEAMGREVTITMKDFIKEIAKK